MTITASTVFGLAGAVGVFAAVFGAITLWRRRLPGHGVGPSVRTALYLTRYAVALEYYGLRRREIRDHVDALRGDLAAIGAGDLDATLQRLGPPRTLAAEVTSGLLRPSTLRGVVWLAVGAVVALTVTVLTAEAFLGGFEAVADEGQSAHWSSLGLELNATMGGDGRSSSIGFGGTLVVVVPLVAFVIGARLWRLPGWLRDRPRRRAG